MLKVTGTAVGHSVGQAKILSRARVMHGNLKSFDLNGAAGSTPSDALRGAPAALGQHISKAPAVGDLVHHRQDVIGIAPPKLAATEILGGDETLLEALHSEGDGATATDAVYPISITHLAHLANRRHIPVHEQATQGGNGFVLRARSLRHLEGSCLDLDYLFTGDWATLAGIAPFNIRSECVHVYLRDKIWSFT